MGAWPRTTSARLVKNAEAYYRSMFLEEVSSWNLRDHHMAETLAALVVHLSRLPSNSSFHDTSVANVHDAIPSAGGLDAKPKRPTPRPPPGRARD
jgi:hypothetical protein